MDSTNKDESLELNTRNKEYAWTIIESYFANKHLNRLVRHQLESYNHWINVQLHKTIDMFNPVRIHSDQFKVNDQYSLEIEINFINFHMYRPQIHENNGATKVMFPHEARLRNFTYASSTTIDISIKYIIRNGSNVQTMHNVLKKIHIGKLPIMLKSSMCVLNQYAHLHEDVTGECKYDPGGYFIINGSEKTVLGQERAAENKVYCFKSNKNASKYGFYAEFKSVPDNKCISPKQLLLCISNADSNHAISIQIPRVKKQIPLFILFRVFNIISDKEICDKIILHTDKVKQQKMLNILLGSILDANTCVSYDDALEYIIQNVSYTPFNMDKEMGIKKKREFALDIIAKDIFPHCKSKEQKIYLLGYMTNCLVKTLLGWRKVDDRDSYQNKRIDLAGVLINNLYRNYFNKVVKDLQKQVIREMNNGSWRSTDDYMNIINQTNIYKIIKSSTIENGIKRSLATGDFGIKQLNSNKVGVAQVLSRLTYISALSHLRRVATPIDKSGKLVQPRKLHTTSWGYLCPAETPEGQSVGVVKNISYMTHITICSDANPLYEYVKPYIIPIEKATLEDITKYVKLFINGSWIGVVSDAVHLYSYLKDLKYKGIINIYTSIYFDYHNKEIYVCNDAGRLVRPILRVKNNKVLLNDSIVKKVENTELLWDNLLLSRPTQESVLEYIDPDEQNTALIAVSPKHLVGPVDSTSIYHYTHCELETSTIFGILASCIPFPEKNQSPRNTYQCAMGKQAMGMYVTNFHNRLDKTSYVLTYPHRPLVDTRIMNMLNLNKIPSGFPVIVAIKSDTGYNQEDSIQFNEGSIKRGLFQAIIYNTDKDEDKNVHGDDVIRGKPVPNKTKGIKFANYDKVNDQGLIPENKLVENRDIIMAKYTPIKENKNDHTKLIKFVDQSRVYRTSEETYIDKNYLGRNGEGYNVCKVRMRTFRQPVIGDKFSSRHGQKGTIGNIIPEADMPFTDNGVRPDIIINPHAIPSRMTIAQLKETLLGKVLLELGMFGDGTSFSELTVDFLTDQLLKLGYEQHGNELLYDGVTGAQHTSSIFMGPVFYQRLKHMVDDKLHSRSYGPMVNLTRQPAEGRSKDGGLRFGEMERDCMIAHGASRFTKDRIYDVSDKYVVYSCKKCGNIASYNDKTHIHICKLCENRTDFAKVLIPYSCKLLWQELITMNVFPRMITN
tara:strand:+ start:1 stop:3537 length:3537 start_codon:yes stop_codon:yes gene_type:complete